MTQFRVARLLELSVIMCKRNNVTRDNHIASLMHSGRRIYVNTRQTATGASFDSAGLTELHARQKPARVCVMCTHLCRIMRPRSLSLGHTTRARAR